MSAILATTAGLAQTTRRRCARVRALRALRAVLWLGAVAAALPAAPVAAQDSRDYVYIVGRRSLYPYIAALIDDFGRNPRYKYPRIDTTNTEAGIKLLCAGAGFDYPDIAAGERAVTDGERGRCRRNDAGEVIDLKVGYDTVVLAARKEGPRFALTARDLYLAFAQMVPAPETDTGRPATGLAGKPVANTNQRWSEIRSDLPDLPIKLLTLPRTDISRDVLTETLMIKGCRQFESIAALEKSNPERFVEVCTTVRGTATDLETDQPDETGEAQPDETVEELTEGTEAILERTAKEDGVLALVRLNHLRGHGDIAALAIDGAEPTVAAVNAGDYPGARPVFLLIKEEHLEITPGLRAFVNRVIHEDTSGPRGYLIEIGLVPLSQEARDQVSARATNIAQPKLPEEDVGPGEAQASPQARLSEIEINLWESVRGSDNPEEIETYLRVFPNGLYARSADARIALLRRRDSDRDGVADYQDRCPDTPAGATVDAEGCPSDADGDGALDGLDKCPKTPPDDKVDAAGCPIVNDSDDDGITDKLDSCPNTVPGAVVDAKGCATDSDVDGITDGIDRCADTPRGAAVDAAGCPSDADGDGVFEGIDQCADTPEGAAADDRGCWVLRVTFGGGAAALDPQSRSILDQAIGVLSNNPDLRVEVQGHTDSTGSRATNLRLSRERAQTVADYLTAQGVPRERLEVVGYGPDRPVASNETAAGRTLNRRVELVPLP